MCIEKNNVPPIIDMIMQQIFFLLIWLTIPVAAGFLYPIVQATPQYLEWLLTGLTVYVLFFSVVLHELAHGLAAYSCGDPTAKNAGRLTLNPISHVDLFGTLIIPIVLSVSKAPTVLGWAKPVPFTPTALRQHPRDQVFLAIAGPFTNFTLSYLCFTGYLISGVVFKRLFPEVDFPSIFSLLSAVTLPVIPGQAFWIVGLKLLGTGMMINAVLGVFNLIPFPPLDGSWLLKAVLPKKVSVVFGKIQAYGFILFIIAAMSGVLKVFLYPVLMILGVFSWIAGMVLGF
jgi:Zn-dependent protease